MTNRRALIGELVSLLGVLAVLAGAVVSVAEHAWVLGALIISGTALYFIGAWFGRKRGV